MSMITTQNYIQSFISTSHNMTPARNFEIIAPTSISIITGFFNQALAPTVTLSDISSSATIDIIDSPNNNSISVDPNSENFFYILEKGSYTFLINYIDTTPDPNITYSYYLSFTAVNPIILPQISDIYQIIKRSEPPGVYTQVQSYIDDFGNTKYSNEYVDVESISTVFDTLYQDVNKIYQLLFPTSGNLSPDYSSINKDGLENWELSLNNTRGLLSNIPSSPTDVNPYYNIILNMLYSLLINNTGNKYDIEFFISKYLYYRSNKTISSYVYIKEVVNVLPPFWVLGISLLGVDTILAPSGPVIYNLTIYVIPQSGTLSEDLENEIINLARRLIPIAYSYSVIFDKTLSDLGLTVNLGQTWKFDPRLKAFAIEFLENNVCQAAGYSDPTAPEAIISISLTPASGALSIGSGTFVVTAHYYSGVTADITLKSTVTSTNPTILTVTGPNAYSANIAGTVSLKFLYGVFNGINNYTVS